MNILCGLPIEIVSINERSHLVLRDDQAIRGSSDVVCNPWFSNVLNIYSQRVIRDRISQPSIRRDQRRTRCFGARDVEAVVDWMVDLRGDLSGTFDQIGTRPQGDCLANSV